MAPELVAYRAAVAEALQEIEPHLHAVESLEKAELVLASFLAGPEATGLGLDPDAVGPTVLNAVRSALVGRSHNPPPVDPRAIVRIHLLSQIDARWWGDRPSYRTGRDLLAAPELVGPTDRGPVAFRYRQQAGNRPVRLLRAVERRLLPRRRPHTAGLLFARARPELVLLLGELAAEFAATAPPGTPALWVNSLARSVDHQNRLRDLGYTATMPSAHCVGYAADLEMRWFSHFGADAHLRRVLLDRMVAGDINLIDEGQVWHVCLSPSAAQRLMKEWTCVE